MVMQINERGGGQFSALDWDDFRVFLAVSDAGSLKAAAKALNSAQNTVRAHIARLEDVVGEPLLIRSRSGIEVTEKGRHLRQIALEMEAASRGLAHRLGASGNSSDVRVAITEGLGVFWMVPRFSLFKQRYPDVLMTLDCKMVEDDLEDRENAIAVQLVRPSSPTMICAKLGAMHLMPFASRDYAARNGLPTSIDEARSHKWVLQEADQVRDELASAYFGDDIPKSLVALRTNSSPAHYWAVSKGIGIGILPTYAGAINNNVIPVTMGLEFRREIWLVYHPDAKRNRSVAKAIEWTKASFDPARFPWFGDSYVHPSEFDAHFREANVVHLFSAFREQAA